MIYYYFRKYNGRFFKPPGEISQVCFRYNWSDILNRNTSLSIPQVQTILSKRWQTLTNQMNTLETKKPSKDKSV